MRAAPVVLAALPHALQPVAAQLVLVQVPAVGAAALDIAVLPDGAVVRAAAVVNLQDSL